MLCGWETVTRKARHQWESISRQMLSNGRANREAGGLYWWISTDDDDDDDDDNWKNIVIKITIKHRALHHIGSKVLWMCENIQI